MENRIAIRRMEETDIDAVAGVYAEVLDPSYISYSELSEGKAEAFGRLSERAPEIFREQLAALHDSPVHGFFVAVAGGEVVGFALASLRRAEAGHTECWLDDIGVRPVWRRGGVAQQLVAEVIRWGKSAGARYYLLESGVRNEAAHGLFEKNGFQPLATVFWLGAAG